MSSLKDIVERPELQTKIKSDDVKISEIALGYFLAPFCAMLANSIFGAYLTRYYADVLGWTKFGSGAFAALLPIVSVVFVVLGNLPPLSFRLDPADGGGHYPDVLIAARRIADGDDLDRGQL